MVLGVLAGAVVYFVWGALSWTVIGLHNKAVKTLPEEQLITDTMKVVIKEPGFYIFPSAKLPSGEMDHAGWAERYKAGPIGSVIFQPNGRAPMVPSQFISSFMIGVVASLVSFLLLSFSRDRIQTLPARVLLLVGVGIMAWVVSDLSYMTWFSFPCDFTIINLLDDVVGFALLGLVLHKFVPAYE